MDKVLSLVNRGSEVVFGAYRQVSLAVAFALAYLVLFANEVWAQTSINEDVPTLGISVTNILAKVQQALQDIMLPFIAFSIGVCIVMLIWRAGRRFAYGNS